MKIATFNVNSIRARLPIVTDWLERNRPDVLAVQETKVQDADFPVEAFNESGYQAVFRGQKTYNGVALFSLGPVRDVAFGLSDEPKDEPRLVRASLNGLTIVNTYVPQGFEIDSDKYQYKLAWFKRLSAYFQEHFAPTDPVVWVGDLNVAPTPIDVHDPESKLEHVCFHADVRKALEHVMAWGFTDLFRLHCPDPEQYTFWDYRGPKTFERNRGWRIDHIMGTEPAAQLCRGCYIDREPRGLERPSDHTPVIAEFEL